VGAQPWARHFIENAQSRLTGADGVATQLNLNENFNEAAEQNQPEEKEPVLGAQRRRQQQFAGADDASGKNDARTNLP
jgi:hypothetical protein